ncbi:MAG: hypothetical protein A2V66_10690, partial [Ignavibacteria bacterium RBG_13_36_8]
MTKAIFIFYLFVVTTADLLAQQNDFPKLTGPYLGQKPPGMMPEIFAPGIVSTGYFEHSSPSISPNGTEIYWSVHYSENSEHSRPIVFMRYENDKWSKPQIAEFIRSEYCYENPFFSADGNRIYFSASLVDQKVIGSDIWYVERTSVGWSDQKKLSIPPNTDNFDAQPSLTKDGSLYYISYYEEASPQYGLYYSKYAGDQYFSPVLMEEKFNKLHADWTPYIAPDESYFIFCSFREGGFGSGDLYVSFKRSDGTWGDVINMGGKINSEANERFPNVTPDGKYLFFNTTKKIS